VNGTSKEKSRWGLFIKLYKLCLDPKLQAKKNHYCYYYYFDEPKKVVTIQTIGEIHDAKTLTHQPSMWLTTTIKQFNQQQHQIMKVIIMCFLSVGSSICPGGCPPPCSKKFIYYYYYLLFIIIILGEESNIKFDLIFLLAFFLLYCKGKNKRSFFRVNCVFFAAKIHHFCEIKN
jgi:hypothetical protein